MQGVASGKAALNLLGAAPFDILIVDVGLPDMSGVDLARRAVAMHPGLPVIFATGERTLPGAADLPNTALLGKPFSAWDLTDAMLRLLSKGAV